MKFLVSSSGFCVILALIIQWKWPTSDFDLELIRKKPCICNSEIGNWHIYSLKFSSGIYILKDIKFLYYKDLKLFLLYIKLWKNLTVKFKCSFPILCYLHSTTPFDSFILSITKQDFSCKWPCCFWELLLSNLLCTIFLCFY